MPKPGFHHVRHWVFDLDNTLYPARCNLFAQIDHRMGDFISNLLNIEVSAAKKLQKHYFRTYGTTLRGLMEEHGLDPQSFLDYVHEIDVSVVPPSPGLSRSLQALPGTKWVFTNGSVAHAERVIGRLGVAGQFDGIFDIVASDYVPKPHPGPYAKFLAENRIDPAAAIMFEDIQANLEPAAALGMATVWITERAQDENPPDHVHHRAPDLADWLADLTA